MAPSTTTSESGIGCGMGSGLRTILAPMVLGRRQPSIAQQKQQQRSIAGTISRSRTFGAASPSSETPRSLPPSQASQSQRQSSLSVAKRPASMPVRASPTPPAAARAPYPTSPTSPPPQPLPSALPSHPTTVSPPSPSPSPSSSSSSSMPAATTATTLYTPCHRSPTYTTRRSTRCCTCTYVRTHQRPPQRCPNIHCRHRFCACCRSEWEFFVFVCSCCDWPMLAERMRDCCDACGATSRNWVGRAEWWTEEGIRGMRAKVVKMMPG